MRGSVPKSRFFAPHNSQTPPAPPLSASTATGFAISAGVLSTWWTFWAFTLVPTPLFCTDASDPCTCTGGGFGIYDQACNLKDAENITKVVNKSRTDFLPFTETMASDEVVAAVATSMCVFVVIVVIFWYARKLNLLNKELAEQATRLKRAQEVKMQVMLDK